MWIVNALSIVCTEMLKLSRNVQNIKMFGVPPNIALHHHYITTCHSKQLPVGLMVLSDGNGPLSEDRDKV